jgi:hypothetical protein
MMAGRQRMRHESSVIVSVSPVDEGKSRKSGGMGVERKAHVKQVEVKVEMKVDNPPDKSVEGVWLEFGLENEGRDSLAEVLSGPQGS